MENIKKLYIAYKAGYLGNNVLDTYFSFVANIISEEQLNFIEDTVIAKKFHERYSIELPLPFLRQILNLGVINNCFIENHGKYSVVIEEIDKYHFNETDFNEMWSVLIDEFNAYCLSIDTEVPSDITSFILSELDKTDDIILSGEKIELSNDISDDNKGISSVEYAWYRFIKQQGDENTELFSFVSALSASNITKQALFYIGNEKADYSDLHVYLDSPIVFSLLGMDEEPRTISYKKLINDMQKSRCNVHVLDHVFQEVDGIINRAASWATNTQYDLKKANKAARFFHDSRMTDSDISEFCNSIETKLNELGVTIVKTDYNIYQNDFQEDETQLFDMVKDKYQEKGYELSSEKEESIQVDVRSIVMIYRKRQGQTATRIQNSKHLMLTTNNAIANVSKKYESNKSIQAGHIPACISVDLFGTILWLDNPMELMEYHKQKMLADCYAFLRPDKTIIDKYIKSLDEARNADLIDEKKYLFLRTHPVVLDSLMNITRGDYARFNSNTYLEVFDDIQSKSLKQFNEERAAHEQTRKQLELSTNEKEEKNKENEDLKRYISILEEERDNNKRELLNKKVNRWALIISIIIVGLPYIIMIVVIELVKTNFDNVSWQSAFGIGGTVVLSLIASLIWLKGKKTVYQRVRTHFERKEHN